MDRNNSTTPEREKGQYLPFTMVFSIIIIINIFTSSPANSILSISSYSPESQLKAHFDIISFPQNYLIHTSTFHTQPLSLPVS